MFLNFTSLTHVFVTLQRIWNETAYDHQLEKFYFNGGGRREVFSFSNFQWDTLYLPTIDQDEDNCFQ